MIARNGHEVIERATEEPPQIILMDIQMPEMDGLMAIQYLKHESSLAHIPIIAITALAMPGDRERCLEMGADDYLSKPLSLRELVKKIEARINKNHR
jgi:CheY-like chemotaxis protein